MITCYYSDRLVQHFRDNNDGRSFSRRRRLPRAFIAEVGRLGLDINKVKENADNTIRLVKYVKETLHLSLAESTRIVEFLLDRPILSDTKIAWAKGHKRSNTYEGR